MPLKRDNVKSPANRRPPTTRGIGTETLSDHPIILSPEQFTLPTRIYNASAAELSQDAAFAAWILGPAARIPIRSTNSTIQAVLFDLDGVLVDTAHFHFLAWKSLAEDLGIHFDERSNLAFRGVSRMECLDKLLGKHARTMAIDEKRVLADRKNAHYLQLVETLAPRDIAPGARQLLADLADAHIRTAVVSASKNARLVLDRLGFTDSFNVIIDGSDTTRGKPDPQGFLLAAKKLPVETEHCIVIEDAEAGIKAGHAAGMVCVGIGEHATGADVAVRGVGELTVENIERAWQLAG